MRVVSSLLKRAVYPGLAGLGYFNLSSKPGLAVVTYHGILPPGYRPIDAAFDGNLITAGTFRRQLQILKRKYNVISPEEMLLWCRGELKLPKRAALLTCDDGFLNNLTEMLPILQEEDLRCLFFVTGASADDRRTMLWHEEFFLMLLRAPAGTFRIVAAGLELEGRLEGVSQRRVLWWNAVKQLSQMDAECRSSFLAAAHAHFEMERSLDYFLAHHPEAQRHFCLMTRSEVQQLVAAGMTIGAHTMTHPVLTRMTARSAWAEIVDSRERLEEVTGQSIWAFAYPYGDYDSVSPELITMAKDAGFESAFVNVGGGLGPVFPLHAIPRVHVSSGMGLGEFEAHVSGFYSALQRMLGRQPQIGIPALESAPAMALQTTSLPHAKTA